MQKISTGFRGIAAVAALFVALACFAAVMPAKAFAAVDMSSAYQDDSVAGPKISYVASPSAGKLDIVLTELIKGADGYQYQVALNKAFTKGLKQAVVSEGSVTLKGLRQGKKYYVRARGYVAGNKIVVCSKWSSASSSKVAIKPAKAKLVGAWELVKSTVSTENSSIQYNRKTLPNVKYTMTFKKNGSVIEKDYAGKKDKAKWAATSKKVGYLVIKGIKYGSLKVKGSSLFLKDGQRTWTFKRLK